MTAPFDHGDDYYRDRMLREYEQKRDELAVFQRATSFRYEPVEVHWGPIYWWDAEAGTMAHAHYDPTSGQTVYWHDKKPSWLARLWERIRR